jgi:hypothetical protein
MFYSRSKKSSGPCFKTGLVPSFLLPSGNLRNIFSSRAAINSRAGILPASLSLTGLNSKCRYFSSLLLEVFRIFPSVAQ